MNLVLIWMHLQELAFISVSLGRTDLVIVINLGRKMVSGALSLSVVVVVVLTRLRVRLLGNGALIMRQTETAAPDTGQLIMQMFLTGERFQVHVITGRTRLGESVCQECINLNEVGTSQIPLPVRFKEN